MTAMQEKITAYLAFVENFNERLPEKEEVYRSYFENFGYDELMPVIESLSQRINAL